MKKQTVLLTLAATVIVLAMGGAGYALYMMGTRHAEPAASALPTAPASPAVDMSSIAAGEQATRRHIKEGIKAGDTDPM